MHSAKPLHNIWQIFTVRRIHRIHSLLNLTVSLSLGKRYFLILLPSTVAGNHLWPPPDPSTRTQDTASPNYSKQHTSQTPSHTTLPKQVHLKPYPNPMSPWTPKHISDHTPYRMPQPHLQPCPQPGQTSQNRLSPTLPCNTHTKSNVKQNTQDAITCGSVTFHHLSYLHV